MADLPAADAARYAADLQRGLQALRLNRSFPEWRPIAAHLAAVGRVPPGQALRLADGAGWPHPDEWLRVRIDKRLAPEILARLAPLEAAGDAAAREKAAYMRAMEAAAPVEAPPLAVALIERQDGAARYEIILDRISLHQPGFVRWTIRLRETGETRFSPDELQAKAAERFTRRLQALAEQPAAAAMVVLQAEPGLWIEELVRGEIGPVEPGEGGPRLSAALSRASPDLERVVVDDPLAGQMPVPDPAALTLAGGAPFGLSHQRKWAVPRGEVAAWQAHLATLGSRSLVYGY